MKDFEGSLKKLKTLATDNPVTPEQIAAHEMAEKLEKRMKRKEKPQQGPILHLNGKVLKAKKAKWKFVRRVEVPYTILRIIPNHSVLNTTLHTLQRSFYEMMAMKFPKYPWQHRQGLHLLIREKPNFWWVCHMNQEEGVKSIEFYMAVPQDLCSSFIMKISNHRQWAGCTINEVEPDKVPFPEENVDLYRVKYTRHDMFSLGFKLPEETTPILETLSITNELYDNESVSIFIKNEAVDRMKWRKLVDLGWRHWDNGGLLHRNEFNLSAIVGGVGNLLKSALHEGKVIMNETKDAFQSQFFSKSTVGPPGTMALSRPVSRERALLLVNGKLSDRTMNKRNLPAFKSSMRVAISSPQYMRRQVLAQSLGSSYSSLGQDNELKLVKINIRAKKELNDLKNWKVKEPDPNMMSVEETSKLMQLPTKMLQDIFHEALEFNQKIEIEIPKSLLDKSGLFAGTAEVKGEEFDIHIPMKDKDMAFGSRVLIGSPRMGKDMDAVNLIVEGKRKHGIGAIVPDVIDERNGHRGMADALRDHLPAEDIIDINLGDFDWPVYLGLNSIQKETGNDRIKSNLIAQYLTNFLMGDDIENHRTREYMMEFAKAVGGDLIDLKLMCLSKKFRGQKIAELKEKNWDTLALEGFHNMKGGHDAIVGPILVRLGQLLGDEFLKPIFGQRSNPDIDLMKWMQEGKVVIFRIPSRKLGEMAVRTIVYWITLITFLTGISLDGKESNGSYLILNEPHQFLTKGMNHFCKRLLLEGPKYRIAPVFLYHTPDVTKELKELHNVILSSSVNWHIFKNNNIKIYEELAHVIAPTFTPDDAYRQTVRAHFIAVWLNSQGKHEAPFMVHAPNLVWKRYDTIDNSKLTEEHSKIYGRHIDEVLKDIQDRQRIIYEEEDDEESSDEVVGIPVKGRGAKKKKTP